MKKTMVATVATLCLCATAEDIPWIYENDHPADLASEGASPVTLAEASSSGLESSALDFFCSHWRDAFDVGLFSVYTPRRGSVIIIR